MKNIIYSLGLTQKEVANKMGISISHLNRILNCKQNVHFSVAVKFEKVTQYPSQRLLEQQQEYNEYYK